MAAHFEFDSPIITDATKKALIENGHTISILRAKNKITMWKSGKIESSEDYNNQRLYNFEALYETQYNFLIERLPNVVQLDKYTVFYSRKTELSYFLMNVPVEVRDRLRGKNRPFKHFKRVFKKHNQDCEGLHGFFLNLPPYGVMLCHEGMLLLADRYCNEKLYSSHPRKEFPWKL